MKERMQNIAVAALDIGTSRIKSAVCCPGLSDRIIHLGSHNNALSYGTSGEVKANYFEIKEKSFDLFSKLGAFLKAHGIEILYIGLCGHVSSLLEWDREKNAPVNHLFPIWRDSTCSKNMEELKELTGPGKGMDFLGSFLPPGTNWLLTKLTGEKAKGFGERSVFVQIGDALFTELTGEFQTHFSSQVSMVHQMEKKYAGGMLAFLGLQSSQLPEINNEGRIRLLPRMAELLSLPPETHVFPSLADYYASFIGLRLYNGEAFVLANTSEVAGICSSQKLPPHERFMQVILNRHFIQYGSTSSGGNIVNWFFENVLNLSVNQKNLSEISRLAAQLSPMECPVFLPYPEGERAPFWNSSLTATFLGIRSFHTRAHLFRALLESIAFARKQTFEFMCAEAPKTVKMGGGSTRNDLWNRIRASVLNIPHLISKEEETAIIGLIDHIAEILGDEYLVKKPRVDYEEVNPDEELARIYLNKYAEFLDGQKRFNIDV
jgi:sugar (pentulose or hexulose) kinase